MGALLRDRLLRRLHQRGRNASRRCPTSPSRYAAPDNATNRALLNAFDLRVIYDKAGDRLWISATLSETVAAMLHSAAAAVEGITPGDRLTRYDNLAPGLPPGGTESHHRRDLEFASNALEFCT